MSIKQNDLQNEQAAVLSQGKSYRTVCNLAGVCNQIHLVVHVQSCILTWWLMVFSHVGFVGY